MPFYFYPMDGYYFILILVMVIGLIAQSRVQSTFIKYSKMQAYSMRRARDVAADLLFRNGINAPVVEVQGTLTDHYNPKTGTVGLSQSVYSSSSVAALAVAAHEIGHVLQHQEGYVPIKIRNAILPVASFGSQVAPFLVILGLIMGFLDLAVVGVWLFGAAFLFQIITLPVEFNASSRAIELLTSGGYIQGEEVGAAKKVLRAAALTYVVAALAALVSLLRYAALVSGGRRRR